MTRTPPVRAVAVAYMLLSGCGSPTTETAESPSSGEMNGPESMADAAVGLPVPGHGDDSDGDAMGMGSQQSDDVDACEGQDCSGEQPGDGVPEPCDGTCGEGQRCDEAQSPAVCVDVTCDELGCEAPLFCIDAPDGQAGSVCEDRSCADDVDCGAAQYCLLNDGGASYCTDDVCEGGATRCSDDDTGVQQCASNGSGWATKFSCESGGACTEEGGSAACPCRDDWDCPSYTQCEVDRCVGTGVEPTCFVPVADMEDVLPQLEFQWGTDDLSTDKVADGRPFPDSAQVVMTPVVANLDDDNGDGLVDERDLPEILFMTFCNSAYTTNGVLRAVHGGGLDSNGNPLAGRDLLASSGSGAGAVIWREADEASTDSLDDGFSCAGADLDPTAGLAVANLDGDAAGVPEIVAITEGARMRIYSADGTVLTESTEKVAGEKNGYPTIANLDGEGLPEIVVGRDVWTLRLDGGVLTIDAHFGGDGSTGKNGQGPVSCIGDLDGDGRQEVVAGQAAYAFPDATDNPQEFADGELITLWDHGDGLCAIADVWGPDPDVAPGPDNPLDGVPEVITVAGGNVVIRSAAGEEIETYSIPGGRGGAPNVDDFDGDGFPEVGTAGSTGYAMVDFQAPAPLDGMAPGCPAWDQQLSGEPVTGVFENDRGPYPVPDPAADGNEPRVLPTRDDGSAIVCRQDSDCNEGISPAAFACHEASGQCVCLHNGWVRDTQDSSSQVTGSSVFDFNGDGTAEVVYNDECFFRVYNGLNGQVYSRIPSESRTRIEYPIVADVDNDGNAEIVFASSNESGFCARVGGDPYSTVYNAGLEVWGEQNDLWVSARRIWNQHAYHITNISESGEVPLLETPSFSPELRSERGYNSYRSNPPSRAGIAPDLQVVAVQVSAAEAGCGELGTAIDITARVRNDGDLRAGAATEVAFTGEWNGVWQPLRDASGDPVVSTVGVTLLPGSEVLVTVRYDSEGKQPEGLPTQIRVEIDPTDAERECFESNNGASVPVMSGPTTADLTLSLDAVEGECSDKRVDYTVTNNGSEASGPVTVRFYAGDPDAGGESLGEAQLQDVPAGQSVGASVQLSFPLRDITVHAVVDPDQLIEECNDGNNAAQIDEPVICLIPPV